MILIGNWGGWVTERSTGDKTSFICREEVVLFRQLVDDLWERKDIMHQADVEEGFAGKLMRLKPFGHDIKARPHGAGNRGRGGSSAGANRGGGNANRGRGRGRGGNNSSRGGGFDQAQGGLGSRGNQGGPGYAGPYFGHEATEGTSLGELLTAPRGRGGARGGRGGDHGGRGGGRGGRGGGNGT